MKSLKDRIIESVKEKEVYVVYFGDGTMYSYYDNEAEANAAAARLNSECSDNKCVIKTEHESNFEKNI